MPSRSPPPNSRPICASSGSRRRRRPCSRMAEPQLAAHLRGRQSQGPAEPIQKQRHPPAPNARRARSGLADRYARAPGGAARLRGKDPPLPYLPGDCEEAPSLRHGDVLPAPRPPRERDVPDCSVKGRRNAPCAILPCADM
jgi:hypothetical protein